MHDFSGHGQYQQGSGLNSSMHGCAERMPATPTMMSMTGSAAGLGTAVLPT
ncbi:hypothetical protein V6U80_09370 [Micromonospora sp. CPCC 205543]